MDDPALNPPSTLEVPPASIPTPTPPPPSTIFRNPAGIRAGWRALIFLTIAVAVLLLLSIAQGIVLVLRFGVEGARAAAASSHMSMLTPVGLALSEGALLFSAVVAALIMSRIERRKFGLYGLPLASAFGKNFWIGLAAGFASISTCLLAIFLLHGFHLTGLALHGSSILYGTAEWTATFLVVGFAEEFVFRGYIQYTLTIGMGFWSAAVVTSALFGLAHKGNPGESNFGLLSVVVFGLLFCLILRRTGNLWWPVGFHAGWDWGQTFFYGVADSGIPPYHNLFGSQFHGPAWLTGGTVGPEASLFTPIVLATVAILVTTFYRQNRYSA